MDWRHLLIAFTILLLLGVAAVAIAKAFGLLLFGAAATTLLVAAIVGAAILAWPLAYLVIAIVYWARPDEKAPSTHYSIDQGREPDKEDRRG